VLSRKTYQNQGICYVTEMFVARNKISLCESGPQR